MVDGAGDWPAKASSPALGFDVLMTSGGECRRLPRLHGRYTSKCTETSPLCQRVPVCAVGVGGDSVAQSGSSRVQACSATPGPSWIGPMLPLVSQRRQASFCAPAPLTAPPRPRAGVVPAGEEAIRVLTLGP